MNSTRLFFRIHSWLGLTTGALMFVLVLSGVYLVYRAELDRFFNPQIRIRPVPTQPASIDMMLQAARRQFPDYNIGYVMFAANERSPFTAYLREIDVDGDVIRHQVYVDVATGQVIAHRLSYHFLTDWMVRIHANLWLPEHWGDPLVAVLGILFTVLGLTGLWVYRRKLGEAFRWHKTTERLGRAHSHFGVWSFLFAVLIGVTGTILNYNSLPILFHRAPPVPLHGINWQQLDRLPSMDELVAESHRAFPELQAHYIYFPGSGPNNLADDVVKVSGKAPNADLIGSSSYVTFALTPTPKVVTVFDARQAPLGRRLIFMTATLHYGDFWGQYSKVLYAIGGLVLTFLTVTGLWVRLRPKRARVMKPTTPEPAVAVK